MPNRSRRWWQLLWGSRRSALFDIGLVLALFLVDWLLNVFVVDAQPAVPDALLPMWGERVLSSAWNVSLLLRRRIPVVLLALALGQAVLHTWLMLTTSGGLVVVHTAADPWIPGATLFLVYAAVVYGSDRRVVWPMLLALTIIGTRIWAPAADAISGGLVLTAVPGILGLYIGARRKLVTALRERAERAEHERELMAEQARAEERARLAGEMHDVVTHRVNLMVLRAGALGVTATDADTRDAAEELRAAGVQALDELRDLVGVLRHPHEGVAEPGTESGAERSAGSVAEPGGSASQAVPLTDELRQLIEQSREVGLQVAIVVEEQPSGLSPAVSRTAYRIVQEALTNVHKHAQGACAEVTVRFGGDRLRLTVHNSAGARPEKVATGSGTGLLGLRQRVELVSGDLHAAPTSDGGFRVDAILPAYVPTREAPMVRPL